MAPCQKDPSDIVEVEPHTQIIQQSGVPDYVKCTSPKPFSNPFNPEKLAPKQVNQALNLNLGQTLIRPNNERLLKVIRFVTELLMSWSEDTLFAMWNKIPLKLRTFLAKTVWNAYLPVHKFFLGNRTGIHKTQSLEYHAMTSAMWFGRLFPMSVKRMRFCLEQLSVGQPTTDDFYTEPIDELIETVENVPEDQKDHCRVQGLFMHYRPDGENRPSSEYTLFWLYGGAFMAGDGT